MTIDEIIKRGIKMTIDEIIKYLPAPECCSTPMDSEKQKEYEAHDAAVIIMRKYQKIEQIVNAELEEYHPLDRDPYRLALIKEVIEDGNNTINTGSN